MRILSKIINKKKIIEIDENIIVKGVLFNIFRKNRKTDIYLKNK
jgi:hypothetical protein